MDVEERASKRSSTSSRKSRASLHLIPTPGVERALPPRYEPLVLRTWVVMSIAGFMIALAIAIEVARHISVTRNGFGVPSRNVFSFVSTSFLTSFFPTLLVFPLAELWQATDWGIRYWQPYVMMSQGNAVARDSVLLDYLSLNKIYAAFVSLRRKHWLVHASLYAAFITNLFQPLASSLFVLQPVPRNTTVSLYLSTTLGVPQDVTTLNAFSSAAGFTDTAVFQNLADPPFVHEGWATAQFQTTDNLGSNATAYAPTTGILTFPNCEPAVSTLDVSDLSNSTISAIGSDGCSATVFFNASSTTSGEDQSDQLYAYGVSQTDRTTCGFEPSLDIGLQPAAFWFYNRDSSTGASIAQTVICRPQIDVFNVIASVWLNNNTLLGVQQDVQYTAANNVTGPTQNGLAFNAVLFNQSQDPFVQARAISIAAGVSGTIFRFAQQSPGGLQAVFSSPSSFTNITTQIYTQHLAVSAKSVYFVPTTGSFDATVSVLMQRLFIEGFPAHALATILLCVSVSGIILHLLHRYERRKLYLTAPPAYHSGAGDLLVPYEDEQGMLRRLAGMRFRLDRWTGAIVAEEVESGDEGDGMLMHAADMGAGAGAEGGAKTEGHASWGSAASGPAQVLPVDVPYEYEPFTPPPFTPPLIPHSPRA